MGFFCFNYCNILIYASNLALSVETRKRGKHIDELWYENKAVKQLRILFDLTAVFIMYLLV